MVHGGHYQFCTCSLADSMIANAVSNSLVSFSSSSFFKYSLRSSNALTKRRWQSGTIIIDSCNTSSSCARREKTSRTKESVRLLRFFFLFVRHRCQQQMNLPFAKHDRLCLRHVISRCALFADPPHVHTLFSPLPSVSIHLFLLWFVLIVDLPLFREIIFKKNTWICDAKKVLCDSERVSVTNNAATNK